MTFELTEQDIKRADSHSLYFCYQQKVPFQDCEDYLAAGRLGLVKATHNYIPQSTTSFSTYSRYRILGELKDYRRFGYHRHNKQPKPQTYAVSLDELIEIGAWQPSADGLEGRTIDKDLCSKLLATLKPRDEQMMRLYFFGEYTLKEIAQMLNRTESRMSQIIKKDLGKLRIRAIRMT